MTKADLVEEVTKLGDLTRRDSETIVETIFDSVIGALKSGDKIEIRGFGSFRIRQRKPRIGRNPKTGTKVEVPAKKVPYFKPSKELRDLVNPSGNTQRPVQAERQPDSLAELAARLFVNQPDLDLCRWTRDRHSCGLKRRRRQGYSGIFGESESLFGDSEEIPVQLHVGVFVVDHDDSVVARSHLKDFRRLSIGDGKASLHDRFRPVARPSGRRGKTTPPAVPLLLRNPVT
jgi:integration host factor subunit beta